MMCFMDMTFCDAACQTKDCPRNWDKRDKTGYNKWSEAFGGEGPVAFSDFSPTCDKYVPDEAVHG